MRNGESKMKLLTVILAVLLEVPDVQVPVMGILKSFDSVKECETFKREHVPPKDMARYQCLALLHPDVKET
jgi:hypothetical protein